MENIYNKFLEMLYFSKEEIDEIGEEWKNAANKLGLTDADMLFAIENWIPKYWDLSIHGVRLCIGVYIREIIDITKIDFYKKEGKKIIYGMSPSQPICFRAIKLAGGENIFVGYPDFVLAVFLGAFFNKLSLYCRDDSYFSDQCRHCALNRTRINTGLRYIIPNPDVIWSWGFFCDEGRKTEEFIDCFSGNQWNYIISCMPHDVCFCEKEDKNIERVKYLSEQFKKGHEDIYRITGIKVTNKNMFDALKENAERIRKLHELNKLVTNSDIQPIGGNELALFGHVVGLTFNTGMSRFDAALDCILEEVKTRIKNKEGILPKGSPKLGCHFTPLCVPWVDRLFMENGVSLTFSSHVSFSKKDFMPFDYRDPYMIAAQIWLRNANSVNLGSHAEIMTDMLQEYDIDGMLYGFFSFDRWLGTSRMTLEMIEEKSGVQHFYIEGDYWDDRNYKQEDRAGRIESIAYFLKSKKLLSKNDEISGTK